MINEKLSSEKVILAIVILVSFGLVSYFVIPKNSPPVSVQPTVSPIITPIITSTPEPTITPEPTPNIDISDWKTYKNDKYGFELKYPKEYESNKIYSIWTLDNEGDILSEWGVNRGQETIFSIDVYAKTNKAKELDWYGEEVSDSEKIFINNAVAKKLDGGKSSWNNIMIENEDYIYIIISSFFPSNNIPQYNEYEAILSTFKFIR